MRRMVYTPKVEVYVKADTGIYDLSPYVTSCTVSRRLNQVSSATVNFRNPHFMFTEHVYKDKVTDRTTVGPVFHPMDPIAIGMTRIKDRPIQVFTGFIDKSPYLHLHPGVASIEASCTLKKLIHTYWDPGLPFVQEWMQAHGWSEGSISGSGGSGIVNQDGTQDQGQGERKTDDGGIGKLLYDVLHEIGNWPDGSIYIEKLPKSIIQMVSNLYEMEKEDSRQAEKDFQAVIQRIIGSNSLGGGNPAGGGSIDPGGEGPPAKSIVTPEEVGLSMLRAGFPADPQILANGMATVEGESDFGRACAADNWGVNDYGCCAGYWQIYLSVHNVSLEEANTLDPATEIAYGIWKNAGNCFACLPGPNPWQGGTDNASSYLSTAQRVLDAVENDDSQDNGNRKPVGSRGA